jgi:mRNA interferase MazF
MKRGEIYLVNLDPTIGSELSKTRPALIISNNVGNQYSERVIVAPITSKSIEKCYPFEVFLEKGEGGLKTQSKVLLDQIRAVDKSRLSKLLGRLDEEKMRLVNTSIRLSLDV